jgi:hypothetical protein
MDADLLIDVAVVAGAGLVMPLASGRRRSWLVAAAAALVALARPTGPGAAALALVWVVVAVAGVVSMGRPLLDGRRRRSLLACAGLLGAGYAVVAGLAFVASRGGVAAFDIGEPIVELTAVHFTYAGVGALALAATSLRLATRREAPLARVAVVLTAAAPPVVAAGFVLGHAVPQVGGAVMMTLGVWATAWTQLRQVRHPLTWDARRVALLVSGLAPWVAMVLAVGWAASNFWSVPALAIPDMARTHGTLQMVFVLCGLWARRSAPEVTTDPVRPALAAT